MRQSLSVSEARRRLPSLLKDIQKDPSTSFIIKVRDEAVATLAPVKKLPRRGLAVKALLRLAKRSKKDRARDTQVHSGNFKEYLYGKHDR